MKVLLFVQNGNGRPKVLGGERRLNLDVPGAAGLAVRLYGVEANTHRADRWWLVECEDANTGRDVIAGVTDDCDRCAGCGWWEGGRTLMTTCRECNGTGAIARGRILSHGSRP